ncbi:MAG: YqaE/Pmp3 family membrane protein [Bacteroidetes bacterium]|nr:YqaE/Pmp3 family membrane protein [Bacteroidota bacterium]
MVSREQYNHLNLNNNSTRVDDVVLAILAIFIPPLAVYLFDDAITANFWVDLLLTFLFWLPGIIFAFLVIFAGVSV